MTRPSEKPIILCLELHAHAQSPAIYYATGICTQYHIFSPFRLGKDPLHMTRLCIKV